MKTFVMGLGLLAIAGASLRADEAEDIAVERVEELGGTVTRDETQPGEPVVAVETGSVSDKTLQDLTALKHLRKLDVTFFRGDVSDVGLGHLAAHKQLQSLRLSVIDCYRPGQPPPPTITDACLKHLSHCKELRSLTIIGANQLTGVGFQHLPKLRELDLSGSAITDEGMKRVAGFTQLETLNLSRTRVSSTGMACLARLEKLRKLDLSVTTATGAALRHLTGLIALRELSLWHSKNVSDEGTRHLAQMKQLRQVDLTGTRVTEQRLARLRKALPQCKVFPEAATPSTSAY